MSFGASVELICRKCGQFLGEMKHIEHILLSVSVSGINQDSPEKCCRIKTTFPIKAEEADKNALNGLQRDQQNISQF